MELRQIQIFIVRPTIVHMDMFSPAAENLLLGTIAHESGGGKHIDQRLSSSDSTLGPAIGLYQIEPWVLNDLYETYLSFRPDKLELVNEPLGDWPDKITQLATNLTFATAVARMIYYRHPKKLPAADDIDGLWWYYKKFFNSMKGKAKESDWKQAYEQLVLPHALK
ncbi:hypothetical protein LCGC14_2909770 [marine sediment metagenome]|uniref:Transglycosylase SLT domain-containing protein n=1 Tax=marine sediment metagenome TaxID=412755 RepID=A0A0F9AI65_9ZZZZ